MTITRRLTGVPLDFAALRQQLGVPEGFPPDVLADAAAAAASGGTQAGADATDIPFVTVDPPGSTDLDQALHIETLRDGWRVRYAIADVASFVRPGGPLDAETRTRGETLYFPDARVPLHPQALSEGAASLLPGQVRPAALWTLELAADATVRSVDVRRARVRSVAQLDYAGLQQAIDGRRAPTAVAALPEVGRARIALARARHAIELDLPEQQVERGGDRGWQLTTRVDLDVERWNAEISLLTGMCAAQLMLDAGYGILRTVPPPDERAVSGLRHAARALGIAWPAAAAPGDVLSGLDRSVPRHVAFLEHAATLLRGAAYTLVDGAPPVQPLHSGIGAPYAHVTAPLRRLVDRFGTEVCLAHCAGEPLPAWVRSAMPSLPAAMAAADRRAREADRAVVDATEAFLLADRVGETFAAVVVDADPHAGTVVLDDPPVRARCHGDGLPEGERVTVRLTAADVATRTVMFEPA